MVEQVYRPRRPKASPLWQCLSGHFDAFLAGYEKRYQSRYGFLRPIIPEVVNKFLDCGDLEHGFARIRCDHCHHEYLLAFSCKGRWFCPSCHQKKVQLFGSLLAETILFPVPHRHFTFGIPKMMKSLSLPKGCGHTSATIATCSRTYATSPVGAVGACPDRPGGPPIFELDLHTALR